MRVFNHSYYIFFPSDACYCTCETITNYVLNPIPRPQSQELHNEEGEAHPLATTYLIKLEMQKLILPCKC